MRWGRFRSDRRQCIKNDQENSRGTYRIDDVGAWYIGAGFFFAPVLAVLSPWPAVTAVLWVLIGVAGLWLGLLGIAMAVGLARILRSGAEIPEDYWRSLVNY